MEIVETAYNKLSLPQLFSTCMYSTSLRSNVVSLYINLANAARRAVDKHGVAGKSIWEKDDMKTLNWCMRLFADLRCFFFVVGGNDGFWQFVYHMALNLRNEDVFLALELRWF